MRRPVASAGKIGGWISVVFTFMTLFNATLMYLYKPEVLKYRAVLGHMVQRVGKAVTGRLPNSGSAPNLEADAAAAMDGGRDMPHLESTYLVRLHRRPLVDSGRSYPMGLSSQEDRHNLLCTLDISESIPATTP